MMDRKRVFAPKSGLIIVLALALLAACGAPEPTPEQIPPTSTSPPATTAPTQAPTPAETPTTAPAEPAISKATRHALFTQAWIFINDNYVYPDFRGLDWEAVRDEYTEKVANAAGDEEFYDLMRQMVDLLGDDHSRFLSPEAVVLEESVNEDLQIPGGIGAQLSQVNGELLFIQVFAGNPASEAGLRPGERLVAVDGVPAEQFSTVSEVISAIIGEAGTEVVLTVRSFDDVDREIAITRAMVDLESALVQGKMIEGTKIALLTLDGFDSPRVAELVRDRLEELVSSGTPEGLIIDLRANPGGDTSALLGTLAIFVDGGTIGSQVGRNEAFDLLIPQGKRMPQLAGLPLVLLTGPHTAGAGEFFAAGMQFHERATIVGQPSAGDTEYSSWHDLSDGSVVFVAGWVYHLPDGTLLEGRGVQPDVVVALDWALYGTGDDPQIQAAIEVLGSE